MYLWGLFSLLLLLLLFLLLVISVTTLVGAVIARRAIQRNVVAPLTPAVVT